ncbi:MAG: spore maturation protein [Clostridia bacterium]|nr:spore maturation protein [Clostridia bacterium]
MKIINYISNLAMPAIILVIVMYGVKEKIKIFESFVNGAKEGIETTFKIFPTLIGLFVAIGALRASGILDLITMLAKPLLNLISFPGELMPLALLRPISGSSSVAVATDIMKKYGVDSILGMMASTIMGSTETTLYTIAIYTSCIKVKKTRGILIAALTADFVGMLVSVIVCRMIFK